MPRGPSDGSMEAKVEGPKRPPDTAFAQQRMKGFRPIFTPMTVGTVFVVIGIPFIFFGAAVNSASSRINEVSLEYSGLSACAIYDKGPASTCTVTLTAEEDMPAPVYVYYELTDFYQNHRRYVKSYDKSQLLGGVEWDEYVEKNCLPLTHAGDQVLHPCGLMANSLFNDKILLSSGQSISYDGIAWSSDADKYIQPEGFKHKADNAIGSACAATGGCTDAQCDAAGYPRGCKGWTCPAGEEGYYGCEQGTSYVYWYPDQDTYQYLHETFPEVVSPLQGVRNERFQVWMRNAALPKFRKLYAVINDDLKKGDGVSFTIQANFDPAIYGGTKALVLTTTTWFGGKNDVLGTLLIVVGVLCLVLGVGFFGKQLFNPRALGDGRLLN